MSFEEQAEQLAMLFYNTYERLAPQFGYKTREPSAKSWAEVMENNRNLMVAVASEIVVKILADKEAAVREALGRVSGWIERNHMQPEDFSDRWYVASAEIKAHVDAQLQGEGGKL